MLLVVIFHFLFCTVWFFISIVYGSDVVLVLFLVSLAAIVQVHEIKNTVSRDVSKVCQ